MPSTSEAPELNRHPIWDLPTRLFHWLIVVAIGFSWWSAEQDELEWHMWSGYFVLTLLLFRLMWGLVGSSTARFANFVRGPRAVLAYARDMRAWRPVGHTPLGALSVLALLGVIALQVGTGLFNSDDDGLYEGALAPRIGERLSDSIHDLHETAFNLLLLLVGLHVAAILLYRILLGKRLVGPMITGTAALESGTEPMRPGRRWLALVCALVALGITRWIIGGAPPFSS